MATAASASSTVVAARPSRSRRGSRDALVAGRLSKPRRLATIQMPRAS